MVKLNFKNVLTVKDSTDETPPFSLDGAIIYAKVVKVYDGDTIHANFILHNDINRYCLRLKGYDSPEMKTKDMDEKNYAVKSRDFLRALILDKIVILECGKMDKYGRILVDVKTYDANLKKVISVNEFMLKYHLGYPYQGKTKETFDKLKSYYNSGPIIPHIQTEDMVYTTTCCWFPLLRNHYKE
jgi:endonuclease YncB( thermonuclease family)